MSVPIHTTLLLCTAALCGTLVYYAHQSQCTFRPLSTHQLYVDTPVPAAAAAAYNDLDATYTTLWCNRISGYQEVENTFSHCNTIDNHHAHHTSYKLNQLYNYSYNTDGGVYSVQHMLNKDSTIGYLTVLHHNCDATRNLPGALTDTAANSYMMHTQGPDYIEAHIMGAEMYALPLQYVEQKQHINTCMYTAEYSVSIASNYTVMVHAVYTDYSDVRTETLYYTRPLFAELLRVNASLTATARPPQFPHMVADAPLPLMQTYAAGRWVHTSHLSYIESEPAALFEYKQPKQMLCAHLPDMSQYRYRSYNNNGVHKHADLTQCNINGPTQKFLFVGDSHTRALFDNLIRVLTSNTEFKAEKQKFNDETHMECHTVSRHEYCYLPSGGWDMTHKTLTAQFNYDDYTGVFVNFGQHPASRQQYTVQQYQLLVDQFVDTVPAHVKSKLTWIDTPYFPRRVDKFVFSLTVPQYGEGRSARRIQMYNQVANAAMQRTGIDSIQIAGESTYAVMDCASDMAHTDAFFVYPKLVRVTDRIKALSQC